ncbi:MAG: hypothetical protein HUJ25_11255 [Crocinitomicaceae bacterium]|nr:hypothetical protein [Crocinitomicaceae bacterium]
MALQYKRSDIIKGGIIYSLGDTIAALIANDFDWVRVVGILLIGATVYAFEIPNYFRWIDKKVAANGDIKGAFKRAGLAMLYFNPLWIARHILFIKLLTGQYDEIGWDLLMTGLISFAINIPISLMANYAIQNKISLKNRFIASAIFSGLMAIYYSMSAVWFN